MWKMREGPREILVSLGLKIRLFTEQSKGNKIILSPGLVKLGPEEERQRDHAMLEYEEGRISQRKEYARNSGKNKRKGYKKLKTGSSICISENSGTYNSEFEVKSNHMRGNRPRLKERGEYLKRIVSLQVHKFRLL